MNGPFLLVQLGRNCDKVAIYCEERGNEQKCHESDGMPRWPISFSLQIGNQLPSNWYNKNATSRRVFSGRVAEEESRKKKKKKKRRSFRDYKSSGQVSRGHVVLLRFFRWANGKTGLLLKTFLQCRTRSGSGRQVSLSVGPEADEEATTSAHPVLSWVSWLWKFRIEVQLFFNNFIDWCHFFFSLVVVTMWRFVQRGLGK